MESLQSFKASITSEVKQNEILQKNLVSKVLSSKRLLVDHIEIIIASDGYSMGDLVEFKKKSKSYISFLTTFGLMSTSYIVFIHFKQSLRYLIPAASSVMPIMYIQKLFNVKKREAVEAKLSRFIVSLDNYEIAVTKNRRFLEAVGSDVLSRAALDRFGKIESIRNSLFESIKININALYNFIRYLETFAIEDELEFVYEPFEDLKDCELMTASLDEAAEQGSDVMFIRNIFNIFAYAQSQLLLRFCLITISNLGDSKTILNEKLNGLTEIIETETESILKFLNILNKVSQEQNNVQKQIDEELSTIPKELREVRAGSVKFSMKMISVALQCHRFEDLMLKIAANYEHPDNKEVDEILSVMKKLESELSVNVDELKRISISFQKYLNIEIDGGKIDQLKLKDAEGQKKDENIERITGDTVVAQVDDFFFVDGNEGELEGGAKSNEPETIEEVNSKLAKKYFKPVLVQLKERIETIGEDMKERERKVLKAKGIDLEYEPEVGKEVDFDDDDGSGSDDERERKMKFERNQEKFRGNREFLESKQPINLFGAGGFPIPLQSQTLDEDVLE